MSRMTSFTKNVAIGFALTLSATAQAAPKMTPVLADVQLLERIGADVLATEPSTGVGFAKLTDDQQRDLTKLAHDYKKCGGFEAIPEVVNEHSLLLSSVFGQLADREAKRHHFVAQTFAFDTMQERPDVTDAINQVSAANVRSTVEFMSSFHDRFNRSSKPNESVEALKARIEQTVKGARLPVQVDLISHRSTGQKSIRAHITGSARPGEIIVLGGHLDSINQEWLGNDAAPGADDNASGSADILEALRIIANQAKAPERSIEFFWYAGEESGLLGSAEIARDYKAANKDVIAVLQLDMTLFPGAGDIVIGSMTDFTSSWLRSYFANLNSIYLKARIVDDKCGYACSDHASWDRQGYPALMPFEATFNTMNENLHTHNDLIDSRSNFDHAAMYAKLAVAMALDLGNSTLREP